MFTHSSNLYVLYQILIQLRFQKNHFVDQFVEVLVQIKAAIFQGPSLNVKPFLEML